MLATLYLRGLDGIFCYWDGIFIYQLMSRPVFVPNNDHSISLSHPDPIYFPTGFEPGQ